LIENDIINGPIGALGTWFLSGGREMVLFTLMFALSAVEGGW